METQKSQLFTSHIIFAFAFSIILIISLPLESGSDDISKLSSQLESIPDNQKAVTTTEIQSQKANKFTMPKCNLELNRTSLYNAGCWSYQTIKNELGTKNEPKSCDFNSIDPSTLIPASSIKREKILMIGFLTVEDHCHRRNTMRSTFLNTTKFSYRFLLDQPSDKILQENATFGDIVILNAKYSGRGVKFGEKLYNWLKYVKENFDSYTFIAKSDDDLFICEEKLIDDLKINVMQIELENNPKRWANLYYGWLWIVNRAFPDRKIERDNLESFYFKNCSANKNFCYNCKVKMDEFFVVLGKNLIDKILEKDYCHKEIYDNKDDCESHGLRFDADYGGASLGCWLKDIQRNQGYFDGEFPIVDAIKRNKLLVHYTDWVRDYRKVRQLYVKMDKDDYNFCNDHAIFHKANSEFIEYFYGKHKRLGDID